VRVGVNVFMYIYLVGISLPMKGISNFRLIHSSKKPSSSNETNLEDDDIMKGIYNNQIKVKKFYSIRTSHISDGNLMTPELYVVLSLKITKYLSLFNFIIFYFPLDNSRENTLGGAPLPPGKLQIYQDWEVPKESNSLLKHGKKLDAKNKTIEKEKLNDVLHVSSRPKSLLTFQGNINHVIPVNNVYTFKLYDSANVGGKDTKWIPSTSSLSPVSSIVCSREMKNRDSMIVKKGETRTGVVIIKCAKTDIEDEVESDDNVENSKVEQNPEIPKLSHDFLKFPSNIKIKTESRKWLEDEDSTWIEIIDDIPDWGILSGFSSNIAPDKVDYDQTLTWHLKFENEEKKDEKKVPKEEKENNDKICISKKEIVIKYAYKRYFEKEQ
jgi:hypothetical protein